MAKRGLFDWAAGRSGASPKQVVPSRVHPSPDELPPPGLWEHLTGRERDESGRSGVRAPAPAVNRPAAPRPGLTRPLVADAPERPDPLTGLPGRKQFEREVQHHAERAGTPSAGYAVLMFDLDRLGRINDSLGRAGGDQVLAEVANRIRDTLRGVDRAARLESDTFAILLDVTATTDEAACMARKLSAALGRPIEAGDEFVMVTACVGGALSSIEGRDTEMLMAAAEKALARAKRRGPRHVEISTGMPSAADRSAGHT